MQVIKSSANRLRLAVQSLQFKPHWCLYFCSYAASTTLKTRRAPRVPKPEPYLVILKIVIKPFPGHASLLLVFSALITSDQILHSLTLDSIDYCRFILCCVRYDNTCVKTSSPCDSPDKQERWACIWPWLDLTWGKRQVRGDIWVTPHSTCKAQSRTGSGPHLKSVENVVVPAEL